MTKVNLKIIFISIIVLMFTGCSAKDNLSLKNMKSQTQIERSPSAIRIKTSKMDVLPRYNADRSDITQVWLFGNDLTLADLTDRENDLFNASFDSNTIWPEKLPDNFNPQNIMDFNKNPGLNLRKLHAQDITGKGVGIAIIGPPLLINHDEIISQLKLYEEINCDKGPADNFASETSSIAVGKNTGVAPGADLYYIACNWSQEDNNLNKLDYSPIAKGINRIIDINKKLPEGEKIRVISISWGWNKFEKGYKEVTSAINNAVKNNIFVVSANLYEIYNNKYYFHGLGLEPMADKDNFGNYSPMSWDKWGTYFSYIGLDDYISNYDKNVPGQQLLIPNNSLTVASATGESDYAFYREGFWYHSIPYISGLYALCCQVNPDITPEIFWGKALKTGIEQKIIKGNKEYIGKIANPEKLIESIK